VVLPRGGVMVGAGGRVHAGGAHPCPMLPMLSMYPVAKAEGAGGEGCLAGCCRWAPCGAALFKGATQAPTPQPHPPITAEARSPLCRLLRLKTPPTPTHPPLHDPCLQVWAADLDDVEGTLLGAIQVEPVVEQPVVEQPVVEEPVVY
jgi:hypothetical protein